MSSNDAAESRSAGACARCFGFGVIADGVDMRRCHRDWHLLFHTAPGRWFPCPRCRRPGGRAAVLALIARLAYRRATGGPAAVWHQDPGAATHLDGSWRRRRLDGQFIFRWRHLIVAPPGPAFGGGWTILEPDGVLRRQHRRQTRHLLRAAGAPPLPD